jgi:hypothetical protein
MGFWLDERGKVILCYSRVIHSAENGKIRMPNDEGNPKDEIRTGASSGYFGRFCCKRLVDGWRVHIGPASVFFLNYFFGLTGFNQV